MQQQSIQKNEAKLDVDKWRKIIDDWRNSGENQKVYCDRRGLNLNTFAYVRSKLLKKENKSNPFVPITIKNTLPENISHIITLGNSRGYKLYLPANLSAEQLMKFFQISGWFDA